MNILILNWRDPKNPKVGGAELVTMEHARAWTKAGHQVTWFTSLFAGARKEETVDGVQIVRRGSPITVLLLAPFFYFLSGKKYDVVIDEIHGLPFFTPLYVHKSRKIAFIHEVAGEIWDYMYPFPVNMLGKFLESFYFSFYKRVPFWTDAPSTIEDLVKHGIPRKNCTAIACPINNSIVTQLPKKEKDPTFIFVSRLVKMKGIENVLEAFATIYKENPKAKLWLVGGGSPKYVQFLKNKIKDLGLTTYDVSSTTPVIAGSPSSVIARSNATKQSQPLDRHGRSIDLSMTSPITFFGRVSEAEKLELMGKAHILLHASVKEGWGLVVLEAASQGTPSVVYKVAGLVDSVKDGTTGIIVKENTPETLGKAALALLENEKEYKKLQQGGLEWVKSLTWDKVTKESLNLISTL